MPTSVTGREASRAAGLVVERPEEARAGLDGGRRAAPAAEDGLPAIGSLATHHMMTLGWFLSRVISSSSARWHCSRRRAMSSGLSSKLRLTAGISSITSTPSRSASVHRLLGVGVVGGAVGVGAHPAEQLVVADEERDVEAAAVDREVLVLAEAGERDRLPVQQQAVAAHLDGADADVERVGVGRAAAVVERHAQRIEVRVSRAPGPRLRARAARPRPRRPGSAAAPRPSPRRARPRPA